jgi:hypothetical protein
VTDERGDPIPGAMVNAAASRFQQSRTASTDEMGRYRIAFLPPGSYVISTQVSDIWPSGMAGPTLGYPKTYFGTGAEGAQRIQLRAGEEVSNIDLSLTPARAATVSGTIVDSRGRPIAAAIGGLMAQEAYGVPFGVPFAQPVRNGTFRIPNVMPGAYMLSLRGGADGVPFNESEATIMPVIVNSSDVTVAVVLSAGWSISGRVVVEESPASSRRPDGLFLRAAPLIRDYGPVFSGDRDSGRVKEDGTFSVKGLYGQARLIVNVPDGWIVRAIRVAGRDVAGKPIEAPNGETLAGVEVVLTNRPPRITGTVTDAAGSPAAAGTVILFSDDRERWFDPLSVPMRPNSTEFIRAARPDQAGSFQMNSIPPGEYLAIAVDYAPDRIWFEPSYLDSLRSYAQRVTLADGETKMLTLKLVTP